MISEELIPGIEGGVDTGRAHKTGTVYDLYYDLQSRSDLKSFRMESAKIWNFLPESLKIITTFNQLKLNISSCYENY